MKNGRGVAMCDGPVGADGVVIRRVRLAAGVAAGVAAAVFSGAASGQVVHGQLFEAQENVIAKRGDGFRVLEQGAGRVGIDFLDYGIDLGVVIAVPATDGGPDLGSSPLNPFVTVTAPLLPATGSTQDIEFFLRWFESPNELTEFTPVPVATFSGAALAFFPFEDGWAAGRAVAGSGDDPRILSIVQGDRAANSTTDRVELFSPATPDEVLIVPPSLVVTDEFFGLDDTWRAGVWDFSDSIDARVDGYAIDLGFDDEGEPIIVSIPPEPLAIVDRGHYSILFNGGGGAGIDAARDGILLATSNVNGPVYALASQDPVNAEPGMYVPEALLAPPFDGFTSGSGGIVTLRENFSDASDGTFFDQDNVQGGFSFVFVPLGTVGLTMGSFTASGYPLISQGTWSVSEIERFVPEPDPDADPPEFTPEMGEVSFQRYGLKIPGQTPETGTLIVQAPNGDSDNLDNIVGWDPEGECWIVTTRDIEPFDEPDPFGQTDEELEGATLAASFVFIPRDINITGPGEPARNYAALFGQPATGVFDVTIEAAPTEEGVDPNTLATRVGGSGLGVSGDRFNDFSLHLFTQRLRTSAVQCLMVTPRGGVRDNTGDGGSAGFPIASTSSNVARLWRANAVEREDGFASDFASVLFTPSQSYALPEDNPDPNQPELRRPYYYIVDERPNGQSGNVQPIPVNLETATGFTDNVLDPTLLPVDTLPFLGTANTSGVLMVNSADTSNRFATVSPVAGEPGDTEAGKRWDVFVYNGSDDDRGNFLAGSLATSSVELNAVYLPYSIPGIIAGRVDLTGLSPAVLDGSGNFTVLPGVAPDTVLIRAAGFDLSNGSLLLNASGGSGPVAMSYEVDDNGDIVVYGWDLMIDNGEGESAGGPALPDGFSFAFLGASLRPICDPSTVGDLLADAASGFIDFGEVIAALAVIDDGCGVPQ